MGIPKFFRFMSERYPCILELINDNQIPDFDNLYLDMNGILHACSHPQEQDSFFRITEEEVFSGIFHYIDILFSMIKPKKLLFLAVDGVAPRAKINQQRGRRFRTAKESEILEKKMKTEGKILPDAPRFDSNCITPGTEFMKKVQCHLEYYVTSRISTNPLWQKCTVILSGHEVPGEGEHKIMEYIRYSKTLPNYNPYTRHCLFGLDADLAVLGLCSHEKNFSLLREEVKFGKHSKKIVPPEETRFFLLHLTLFREYIDLEFQHLKTKLSFEYDLEKIVDDWVLMGFILGNDFIPHLPDFHIAKGAYLVLYKAYIEVLPTLDGYLNENGFLNLPRFQKFLEILSKHDLEQFEETYANLAYLEEKTGRKFTPGKSRNPELEKLIDMTNEVLAFSEEDSSDDEHDTELCSLEDDNDDENTFYKEFCLHKRDYYTNKLDYLNVTDEVLKSQAECYIRGLQWILHYYYHGCQSWSWFYPHHYAPFSSDIINFKDVKLDFDMGKPFLPFEQLLALLPPKSKDLLPKAYHDLLLSSNSPIKHYYPENFETDLNGKQNDWEAVILLPFIDENELLSAMEEKNANLTLEERSRNKHSPMQIYSYTTENLGVYEAPESFTSVRSNHAVVKTLWRDELSVDIADLKFSRNQNLDPDLYFMGFPTFKHIDFEVRKEKGKIKIFNQVSKNENIVLSIIEKETSTVAEVASELLGKIVYVNWPFLREARVVAVADMNSNHYINEQGNFMSIQDKLSEEKKANWSTTISSLSHHYFEKQGIDVGSTKILLYVNHLEGLQQNFDTPADISLTKIWSESTERYPLQTIVKDLKVYRDQDSFFKTIEEIFPPDSVVFMLGLPYYGCMGRIKQTTDRLKKGQLRVELEIPVEHKIDKKLLSQSMTVYYSASAAAHRLGISKHLVVKISGTILIDMSDPKEQLDKFKNVNIGLELKYNSKNMEVPGYTKKKDYWMYSNKAIDIIQEYVIKFPYVVDYLVRNIENDLIIPRRQIFPGPKGVEEVNKIVNWIKSLECSKIERTKCGSQLLETEVVSEIERIIDSSKKDLTYKTINVKPHLLFKSEIVSSGLPPVPTADHQLFDRIISVKSSHTVPLGLRGYIIGIHKGLSSSDYMYDILYDEPFPSGMTLNCSPGRGYKTSRKSFLNISYGERIQKLPKQAKSNQVEVNRSLKIPGMLTQEKLASAFAHWNQFQSAPPYEDKGDRFKSLWSYLEKVKSQDETKVLKKILKIEEEKPKIEDNVKNFFENISKNADALIPKSKNEESTNMKIILQKSQQQTDNKSCLLLFNYFQSRNLVQPEFQTLEYGGKIMSQVTLPDGRTFTGLPCHDEESANESAASQALGGLKGVQFANSISNEYVTHREVEKSNKIMENQTKLEKALFKGMDFRTNNKNFETQKLTNNSKLKAPNDKNGRGKKIVQQNHRKSTVPNVLPTPPLLWCKQYKNSASLNMDQFKGCSLNIQNEEFNLRPDIVTKHENFTMCRIPTESTIYSPDVQHISKMDPPHGFRQQNWRQEEKQRTQQGETRSTNEFLRSNNWRNRPCQSESTQAPRFRSSIYNTKQGNSSGQDKAKMDCTQDTPNDTGQRFSAAVTEFIPLQAITRNRNRGNFLTTTPKPVKEVKLSPSKLSTMKSVVPTPEVTHFSNEEDKHENLFPTTQAKGKMLLRQEGKYNTRFYRPRQGNREKVRSLQNSIPNGIRKPN